MRRLAFGLALLVAPSAFAGTIAESLRAGHQVEMLTSGQSSFRKRFANIKDADVVFVKTYAFLDDETGHAMIDALKERALAGKKVFVEYDVKGSNKGALRLIGNALGFGRKLPPYLQQLADAGVTVIPTNMPTPTKPLFGRDHDKLLVTWKEGEPVRVVMGGMNIGNHYAWAGNWSKNDKPAEAGYRDTDIALTGPETAHVMGRFLQAASRAKPGKDTIAALSKTIGDVARHDEAFAPQEGPHSGDVKFYSNDPKGGRHTIEKLYEQLIEETPAGETITMSNAYTLLTRRAEKAVQAAIARGVKFHFIVNAPEAQEAEASALGLAFRDQLRSLLKKVPDGAIQVTEFAGNDKRNESIIHQKIAKFGSKGPVVVGSHNLDSISAHFNSEAVAVINSHRASQQFDGLVNRMQREGKTRQIDRKTLARDSLAVKVKGFVLHRIAGKAL